MTADPLDHRVTAELETGGAFASFLTVPRSRELLGTGRPVKVSGTLSVADAPVPFDATLMPSGSGDHWLPLRAALVTALGSPAAGTPVHVHLLGRRS